MSSGDPHLTAAKTWRLGRGKGCKCSWGEILIAVSKRMDCVVSDVLICLEQEEQQEKEKQEEEGVRPG